MDKNKIIQACESANEQKRGATILTVIGSIELIPGIIINEIEKQITGRHPKSREKEDIRFDEIRDIVFDI